MTSRRLDIRDEEEAREVRGLDFFGGFFGSELGLSFSKDSAGYMFLTAVLKGHEVINVTFQPFDFVF